MANNNECLVGQIGVTRKDCDCIKTDLEIPATNEDVADNDWYKKSISGLFIHELPGVVEIDTVKDIISCEKLSDHYETLISNAIRDTSKDVSGQINERYSKKESNFVGYIGAKSADYALELPAGFAALKISVNETTGGVLGINAIGTVMNIENQFDIQVFRRYVETDIYELVDTIEGVNSGEGRYVDNIFEEQLILPMKIENEGDIEYYFVYPVGEMQPMNNLASCGCGKKEHDLRSLIAYYGVNGNDIDEIGDWNHSEHGYGLVLSAELRCNSEATICQMMKTSPEWSAFMAEAILLKAAINLNKSVVVSTRITQEVMMNRETIEQSNDEFEDSYWKRVRYLVQNINLNLTDCYTCNGKKLKVQQIFV